MQARILIAAAFAATLVAPAAPSAAATLDDVIAALNRLHQDNDAMRRDNAEIRRENAAMHREIAALRRERGQASPPAVVRTSAGDVRVPARTVQAESLPRTLPGVVSPRSAGQPIYRDEIYDWGGLYAGANFGYAWGQSVTTVVVPPALGVAGQYRGGFAGLQLGYNLQYDRLVLGLEGDYQQTSLGGGQNYLIGVGGVAPTTNEIDRFGTVRARIGYAFNRFLPYATGGIAFAHNKTSVEFAAGSPLSDNQIHSGWTLGGGLEYGLDSGWSGKVEYLHVDLAARDYLTDLLGGTYTVKPSFDLVRAGVNYHF